jgi:hypothetical protein
MKRLGKRYEVEIYDGAGHAFLRQQDAREGANLRAAQQAWPRTVQFFQEALSDSMSLAPVQAQPAAFVDPLCVCGEEGWSAGVAAADAATATGAAVSD